MDSITKNELLELLKDDEIKEIIILIIKKAIESGQLSFWFLI